MKPKAVGWALGTLLVIVATVLLGFVGFGASVAMVLLIAFVPGCGAWLAAAVGVFVLFWQLGTGGGAFALIVGLIALFIFGIVDNERQGRPWYATPQAPKLTGKEPQEGSDSGQRTG